MDNTTGKTEKKRKSFASKLAIVLTLFTVLAVFTAVMTMAKPLSLKQGKVDEGSSNSLLNKAIRNNAEGVIYDRLGNPITVAENVTDRVLKINPIYTEAFSSIVGFNSIYHPISGLRNAQAEVLYNYNRPDDADGVGGDLYLTVHSGLQQACVDALGQTVGSVTIIDCDTFEVLALAGRTYRGSAYYDPALGDPPVVGTDFFDANRVDEPMPGAVGQFSKSEEYAEGEKTLENFFVNRSLISRDYYGYMLEYGKNPWDPSAKFLYHQAMLPDDPPGSVIKILTTIGLLENYKIKDLTWDGHVYESGTTKVFFSELNGTVEDAENYSVNLLSLEEGLVHSLNTYFAWAGMKLGYSKLTAILDRFNFNTFVDLDFYPDSLVDTEKGLASYTDPEKTSKLRWVADSSYGQGGLSTSPFFLCTCLAAIMNEDGVMYRPYMIKYVKNDDTVTVSELETYNGKSKAKNKVIDKAEKKELLNLLETVAAHYSELNRGLSLEKKDRLFAKTGTAQNPARLYYYTKDANGNEVKKTGNHVYMLAGLEHNGKRYAICLDRVFEPNYAVNALSPVMNEIVKYLLENDVSVAIPSDNLYEARHYDSGK